MKAHHIFYLVATLAISSCATNPDFGSSNSSVANLTFTKSGKLYADSTEILLVSPPPRLTADLLIDYLKKRHTKSRIESIQLVRETGTKASFDADTMVKLVTFARSKGIEIKGPQMFEDAVLGFRISH